MVTECIISENYELVFMVYSVSCVCRKIYGRQHFPLGRRFDKTFDSLILIFHHFSFCGVYIVINLCQWDQLDSVYQFNWNFSNLEVSYKLIFAFNISLTDFLPIVDIGVV